jgi:hypothetical protein
LALPLSAAGLACGGVTAATIKAAARRAARAGFKLKAPYPKYKVAFFEFHMWFVTAKGSNGIW